jgi:translation initiation factor 6 (eIF-6)
MIRCWAVSVEEGSVNMGTCMIRAGADFNGSGMCIAVL